MRNNLTKSLALMLAVIMALGLAACGKKTADTDSTQPQTTIPMQKETESTVAVENHTDQGSEISYPLNTDDTLTLWSTNQIKLSQAFADYTSSPFHMGLAEKTGVKVEWQFPAKGANYTQAYNLLLTEDVLPDIIFHSVAAGTADTLIDDGIIYDLTEYLPKYAPDYWAYVNAQTKSVKYPPMQQKSSWMMTGHTILHGLVGERVAYT